MHAVDRVVFNDLDEFVVARHPLRDWAAMAARFDHYFRSAVSTSGSTPLNSGPGRYCAFAFRSAFFDPMTPPAVAYVGGGSGNLMTSLLGAVAYELESDVRTELFSSVRTKVRFAAECRRCGRLLHGSRTSEPAGCRCCSRSVGETDGQTDGRLTVTETFLFVPLWRNHTNGVRGVRTPCQENTYFLP